MSHHPQTVKHASMQDLGLYISSDKFDLYEKFGGDKINIDDIDDVKNAFDNDNDHKLIQLYVKVNEIIIHFDNKKLHYKIKKDINTWTDNDYLKWRKSIQKKLNFSNEFKLYEKYERGKIDIDDIDDIKNAFDYKLNKDQNNKLIHLYVECI